MNTYQRKIMALAMVMSFAAASAWAQTPTEETSANHKHGKHQSGHSGYKKHIDTKQVESKSEHKK